MVLAIDIKEETVTLSFKAGSNYEAMKYIVLPAGHHLARMGYMAESMANRWGGVESTVLSCIVTIPRIRCIFGKRPAT